MGRQKIRMIANWECFKDGKMSSWGEGEELIIGVLGVRVTAYCLGQVKQKGEGSVKVSSELWRRVTRLKLLYH